MIRISNRTQQELLSIAGQQVQYIDRIVEVPVEKIIYMQSIPEVQTIEVSSPPQIITIEKIIESQDSINFQKLIDEQNVNHALLLQDNKDWNNQRFDSLKTELEMQRRALIALKNQRDIDRNRRLMLLRRIKKEQNIHKKNELKLKIGLTISLLVSIITLFIKL